MAEIIEIIPPFHSDEFKAIWKEWIEYRKEEKRLPPYKPLGIKRAYNWLIEISGNNEQSAIEAIKFSMAQQYQGIFPNKTFNNGISNNRGSNSQVHPKQVSGTGGY